MNPVLSMDNLPSKFLNYLVKDEMKAEIDQFFKNGLSPISPDKNNIFETSKWMIKGFRDNMESTHDTHIYRIRKASKINTYIHENGYQGSFMVPEKHLYWNQEKKQFYVIAQKIDLKKNEKKIITSFQVKVLSELAFETDLSDLGEHNLEFTKEGKVAIIDTEPVNRVFKKISKIYCFTYFFKTLTSIHKLAGLVGMRTLRTINWLIIDETSVRTYVGCFGIKNLWYLCHDSEKLAELTKVNNRYTLSCVAKLILKVAVGVFLLCYFYTTLPSLQTFSGSALNVFKLSLYALAVIKTLSLSLTIPIVWVYSRLR